jgi:hypothetical protein
VGVVLASTTQPAWVCHVLEHIRAAHQLTAIVFANDAAPEREPLVARWFHRIDRLLYGRKPDGLTPRDAAPLLAGLPPTGAVDVWLAFVPYTSTAGEVWIIERDGLWEFATRQPTMHARIRAGNRVLASTSAMPDAISYRRAMSRLGWRIAAMIEQQLDRRASTSTPTTEAEPRQVRTVSNARMLRTALSSAASYVLQQYRDRFTHLQWSLAFTFDGSLDFRRFHRIVPPPDRLWADPFVVADGDRAWIFLEELVYAEDRGVISVLEVRRDGSWSPPRRILERPYHLSYPCVIRWNGEWYMLPETHENRAIELYRCIEFPYRWEPDTVLMRDVSAVDATLFEHSGRWWMYYATDSGDAAGFDRLWLFHAPTPRGPWTPHRWNPLECNVAGGRPAGRPFLRDGKLLRAGQDGAPWYGHAMRLRELVTLTPDEWEEREVATILPDWTAGIIGTHTLNVDGPVAVVDAVQRLRR